MTSLAYRPVILIGPSGAGKSTVAEQLVLQAPVEVVPTITTRPVRTDEDTFTHTFVDQPTFDRMRAGQEFIGVTHAFGYDYGLPKLPTTNKQLLLLLRAPFIPLFRKVYANTFVIQLEAPLPVLLERLALRGDHIRADSADLQNEITLGRQVADLIISTDQPLETYIDTIKSHLFVP